MTFHAKDAKKVNGFAESLGWTVIDSVLKSPFHDGYSQSSVYCGLERIDDDEDDLLDWMNMTSALLLDEGIPTLAKRIDRVIFDSRVGVDEITTTREDRGQRYDDATEDQATDASGPTGLDSVAAS